MDPNNKKSSILSAVAVEAGIVIVLLVAIIVTLNYFGIIPLSKYLSFLPSQSSVSLNGKLPDQAKVLLEGIGCDPLPRGTVVRVSRPAASVSATLAKFSGTWKGAWSNRSIPAVLIVRRVTPDSATVGYYYNGSAVRRAANYKVIANDKIGDRRNRMVFQINPEEDTIHGSFLQDGKVTSTIDMRRCASTLDNSQAN